MAPWPTILLPAGRRVRDTASPLCSQQRPTRTGPRPPKGSAETFRPFTVGMFGFRSCEMETQLPTDEDEMMPSADNPGELQVYPLRSTPHGVRM